MSWFPLFLILNRLQLDTVIALPELIPFEFIRTHTQLTSHAVELFEWIIQYMYWTQEYNGFKTHERGTFLDLPTKVFETNYEYKCNNSYINIKYIYIVDN